MTRVMYDGIFPVNIPDPNPQMVAGYVGGNWPTFASGEIQRRFPDAVHVSVAVASTFDAMVLDVERFDATPAEVPGWVMRQRAREQEPSVYMNDSTWQACQDVCTQKQVPWPQWWVAKYDGVAVLPPGAACKQYLGNVPPGYDMSVVADYWLGVDDVALNPDEHDALMRIDVATSALAKRLAAIDLVDWSILGGGPDHSPSMRSVLAQEQNQLAVIAGLVDPVKLAAALSPFLPTTGATVADIETALRNVFATLGTSTGGTP